MSYEVLEINMELSENGKGSLDFPGNTWIWQRSSYAQFYFLVLLLFVFYCTMQSCRDGSEPSEEEVIKDSTADPTLVTEDTIISQIPEADTGLNPIELCTIVGDETWNFGLEGFQKITKTQDGVNWVEVHPDQVADKMLLWDTDEVTVYFFDKTPTIKQVVLDEIIRIANQWQPYSGIKFTPVQKPEQSDIRVSLRVKNTWSLIGTSALKEKFTACTMGLNYLDITYRKDPKKFRSIVLHEFGHALGLIHEHRHPEMTLLWDTAAVLHFYKQYSTTWVFQNVIDKYSATTGFYDSPDPKSIMIYAIPDTLLKNKKGIKQPDSLSIQDQYFVHKIYHLN
jgi:hypothetical protein